ncbi:MAG TPA: flavodoxin family protein, partial [Acidimicrobiia bacterium]|nr:flavodoxin family protein [Acidimicrobiia bacterium]
MTELSPKQAELCRQTRWDFTDLRALFINCTLKRSPELSHTQGLADISMEIMRRQGVTVDGIRAVDHDIATGVWPDMTGHGWDVDEWPEIFEK